MTTYRVLLSGSHSVEIAAPKVDVGNLRLWFYDEDDHLIAVFWWKRIKAS
jgi:hypothetical protein